MTITRNKSRKLITVQSACRWPHWTPIRHATNRCGIHFHGLCTGFTAEINTDKRIVICLSKSLL